MGLNVIPCRPKSKLPAITWGEYQHKKYEGQLAQNNAVICGVTSGNLIVVDLDDPTLANTVFRDWQGVLNNTLVVETGKKGYHVYLRTDGFLPNTMRVNHPDGRHLDIQSQGAYVVAPGSIHPDTGREYHVISNTVSIMTTNVNNLLDELIRLGFKGVNERLPPVKELVNEVPVGMRNNATFKYAAHLIGTLNLPEDMVRAEIKRWASYLKFTPKPGELDAVVDSALKRVKRQEKEDIVYAPETILKLKQLSSEFEGREVTFGAYITNVGEQTTVSTSVLARCPDCEVELQVDGDGYVNPKIPKCKACKVKMEQKSILETVDMKQVYLQDLQEDMDYNNPTIFVARVIGDNIRKVATTKRVKMTATFKSFSSMERGTKRHNEVILLVKDIEDMDEPMEDTMTEQELDNVRKMRDEMPDFEQRLWKSYNPDIVGHERIKEGLMLAAARGSESVTRRVLIHIGIAGNQSKGKSELVRWHWRITGGGYVIGTNSTKAGLGTGMVKLPDGTSIPVVGPLVQYSDKSFGVDELDKMHIDNQFALLECMEQEEVTSAKSSISRQEKHRARTTIVSGFNFKYGNWDDKEDLVTNLNIYPALVNRFALIFRILDYEDVTNQAIADKILGLVEQEQPLMDERTLRKYVNTVKSHTPGITKEGKLRIKEFFVKRAKKKDKNDLAMEVRQLEDFARMVTARAKLLLKPEADTTDVEAIIDLYKYMLESWGIDTSKDIMQLRLQSEEQNKEQSLMELVRACKDTDGNFSQAEVVERWSATKWFDSPAEAVKQFNRWSADRFLLNRDGSYHLAHGY